MKKRLFACLLTAAMLAGLFPLPVLALEAADSGAFGDGNAWRWELDREGKFTITGEGKMPDFDGFGDPSPWYEHRSEIKNAEILRPLRLCSVFLSRGARNGVRRPLSREGGGQNAYSVPTGAERGNLNQRGGSRL